MIVQIGVILFKIYTNYQVFAAVFEAMRGKRIHRTV